MFVLQVIGLIFASMFVLSAIGAVLMWRDKRNACLGRARTPEKTLLTLSLMGGWPGGWWAMKRFRHKTKKTRFRIAFALAAATHALICGILIWYTR
ncbi:MAG: DUF1294 domain-containing protein [Planctomycetota bacterium]